MGSKIWGGSIWAPVTILLLSSIVMMMTPTNAYGKEPSALSVPCINFAKGGEQLSDAFCNQGANGLHVAFKGIGKMQLGEEGEEKGKAKPGAVESPSNTNSFMVKWNMQKGVIEELLWSKSGQAGTSSRIAGSVDNLHFEAARIVLVTWIKDDQPLGVSIPAPAGSDNLDFDIAMKMQIATRGKIVPSEAGTAEFQLSVEDREFSIVVTGEGVGSLLFSKEELSLTLENDGSSGMIEVEIPKELLDGEFTVSADDETIKFDLSHTETSSILLIEKPADSSVITIQGTTVIPEFPFPFVLLSFVAVMSIALIIAKIKYSVRR